MPSALRGFILQVVLASTWDKRAESGKGGGGGSAEEDNEPTSEQNANTN